jgi:uncharacterized membrane protein
MSKALRQIIIVLITAAIMILVVALVNGALVSLIRFDDKSGGIIIGPAHIPMIFVPVILVVIPVALLWLLKFFKGRGREK